MRTRSTLELPRLSLEERDRRWAAVRKEMAARGLDAIVLWGWPTMWDFYTANARYLCPIGGNAEFNVLIFPAAGEPTSIMQMPTFLDGWRAAQNWVSRRAAAHQDLGRLGRQPHQGVEARRRPDRHGRLRRAARSGRLAAARRSPSHDGADAERRASSISTTCWRRSAPSRAPRNSMSLRQAAKLGDLMLADMPRHRTARRQGMRGLCRHDAGDDGERRRRADAVSVGLRPLPLSASVPRADHAADGEGRSHHLRDASEVSAATSPMSSGPSVSASRSRSSSKSMRAASPPTTCGLEHFGPGKTISTAMDAVKDEIDLARPRHLRSRHPRPRPRLAGISALPPSRHRRRPRGDQGDRRPFRAGHGVRVQHRPVRSEVAGRQDRLRVRRDDRDHRHRRAPHAHFPTEFQKIPV